MYYLRMKISRIANKSIFLTFSSVFLGVLISCGSTNVQPQVQEEPPKPEVEEPAPVVEETEPVVEEPAPVVEEPAPVVEEPAPVVVEPEPVVEEPAPVIAEPEPVIEEPAADDEYERSVGAVSVDRNTFAGDKEEVLRIISELAEIMADSASNKSYNAWLGYVEQSSKDYWKLRKNLQAAQKKLPVKGIRLQSLQDYFKHVFCPARRGREVTEIRYISDTYIKAVQVHKTEGADAREAPVTVYYYFNKINGHWMIHLPTNEELN